MPERLPLWVELAQQSIEVFVGAPLLRTVRIREEHFAAHRFLHGLVVRKLDTVIECERVNRPLFERQTNDFRHDAWTECLHLSHNVRPARSVNQREERVPRVVFDTVHEIALPIARADLFLNDLGSLADMPFIRLPRPLPLSVCESRAALKPQQKLSALPHAVRPIVYRLEADATAHTDPIHASDDLLRGETLLQLIHALHLKLRIVLDDTERSPCIESSCPEKCPGVGRIVYAASVRVAPYFAEDCRAMFSQNCRYCANAPAFRKRPPNIPALFKRKLRELPTRRCHASYVSSHRSRCCACPPVTALEDDQADVTEFYCAPNSVQLVQVDSAGILHA
jgi:hypothetical protein